MYISIKLTVYFEDPFWVGVFERCEEDNLFATKVFFGSEPKDYEIYEFVLSKFQSVHFSNSVKLENVTEKRINPKRMQKKLKKEIQCNGVGTKSQQALKLKQESRKIEKKIISKSNADRLENEKFVKRQLKKKEKKKGH